MSQDSLAPHTIWTRLPNESCAKQRRGDRLESSPTGTVRSAEDSPFHTVLGDSPRSSISSSTFSGATPSSSASPARQPVNLPPPPSSGAGGVGLPSSPRSVTNKAALFPEPQYTSFGSFPTASVASELLQGRRVSTGTAVALASVTPTTESDPTATDEALAEIFAGQVRPHFRASATTTTARSTLLTLPPPPPPPQSQLVPPRRESIVALGPAPSGSVHGSQAPSYFSAPPPRPGHLRPRSHSHSTAALSEPGPERHANSNAMNGVFPGAQRGANTSPSSAGTRYPATGQQAQDRDHHAHGYRPALGSAASYSSSLPASTNPISIGGGGPSAADLPLSPSSSRPRLGQFVSGSYSGTSAFDNGWRSPAADYTRHASFTSPGWDERQGRARSRDDHQPNSHRPWGAENDGDRQYHNNHNNNNGGGGGIGYSNMSPFTRDGARTLADAPGDGAALYRQRRDYSLGAVGSGRKRSDSEWGRERTLKETEDEDDETLAPPTKSGATSRRHSFAAFNPSSRSQVGFHLPDEDRDKLGFTSMSSSNHNTFPSAGIGSNALRGGGLGSSAIDDDDLAADLNSLHLNLEAHAASQQREEKRHVSFVGSMPANFPPAHGSRALADDDDDDDHRGSTLRSPAATLSSTAPLRSPPIGSGAPSRFFQPSPSSPTTSVTPSTAQRSSSRFEFGSGAPAQTMPSGSMALNDFGLSAFGGGPTTGYGAGPGRSSPGSQFAQQAQAQAQAHVQTTAGRYPQPFGLPPPPASTGFYSGNLPAPAGQPGFSPFPGQHMSSPFPPQTQNFVPPGPSPQLAKMGPSYGSQQHAPGSSGAGNDLVNLGRGVPLHSVPANAPLYIVEFKAGRKDLFYVDDPNLQLKQGDLVIVEADRGRDVGKFFKPCSLEEVQAFQQRLVEMALGQLATAGQGGQGAPPPPNAAALARMTKEFQPKKLYGKASPQDTQMLLSKAQDEVKALSLIRSKVAQKNLPMEVCDAEWQWDRRKLTFYYTADTRVDFRELVRELFRVYKTRVWMCCLDQQSGVWDFK